MLENNIQVLYWRRMHQLVPLDDLEGRMMNLLCWRTLLLRR